MSKQFIVEVEGNGSLKLRTPDSLSNPLSSAMVLSHHQLGVDTKPYALDDFLDDVRDAVWIAWDELRKEKQ